MKKKFLSVLAVACVACLSAALLAGCSQQQSSSNDGNPADNKLIVGFDNSYPPYGFMDENNNPTGFDLDLAQEVANRNGWDHRAFCHRLGYQGCSAEPGYYQLHLERLHHGRPRR